MCGVGGVHRADGEPVDRAVLHRMTRVLGHRGPDEAATWTGPGIGLAHTRLSVIDLPDSHQPMRSADGRWVLSFNGEVFNYADLRGRLDYPFRTHGDTEVLLAGLTLHGIGFVERLRGQFAFAAHDLHTGTTHLVRDRLGILPLFHARLPHGIVFGSEIKALVAAGVEFEVDARTLDAYLASRAVPSPDTLVSGVRKLPPAHRAVLDRAGRVEVVRYWSPPPVDAARTWTRAEAVDAVDHGVAAAVASALVADVPVGAYLSGGVDSSLIVAHMCRLRDDGPVATFAAGFGDVRHDDLPWARQVSNLLGTEHHEVSVRARDVEDLLPSLTWHRDAPMSEPADVAVFRLAEAARGRVRVVLSGEGGDELFGGYPKYRYAGLAHRLGSVPASVREVVLGGIERRLGVRHARVRVALRAAAAADHTERLRTWFAPFTASERLQLLGDHPGGPIRGAGAVHGADPVDTMLRHDLRSWLPDNLLERGDRMSMAASVELRPPLLDHHLTELACRFPSAVKVHRGVTKWVLKEAARRHLPAEVVDRPKVGFRVPLDRWFRGELRDTAWDRLTGSESWVGETMDGAAVRALLERHQTGAANEEARLWTLLCLEVWHHGLVRSAQAGQPAVPARSETHRGADVLGVPARSTSGPVPLRVT